MKQSFQVENSGKLYQYDFYRRNLVCFDVKQE